jgi:hypothetical protein
MTSQGTSAVAVGDSAGQTSQSQYAVAVGRGSGSSLQGDAAIAIGNAAGSVSQATLAIAIGKQAGQGSQGAAAIAIGYGAGNSNQAGNSICINASGSLVENTTVGSCVIKPIRGQAGTPNLVYNSTSGEITWNNSSRDSKHDITPLLLDSTKVYLLEARSFVYNYDVDAGIQSGYIAEEVADVDLYFASCSREDGKPFNINWNAVQVCVVEEMKKLRAEVDALKAQLAPAPASQ